MRTTVPIVTPAGLATLLAALLGVLLPQAAAVAQTTPAPVEYDSAVALFEAGRFEKAEPALRTRAGERPTDATAAYWHGRVLLARGRTGPAMKELERAVALDSTVVRHRVWLARATMEEAKQASIFRRPGLAKRVRRLLEGAVAYAPDDLEARRELLTFYVMAPGSMGGGMDKARGQADAIAARDACLGHLASAQIYRKRKAADEESSLQAAMAVCPDTLESYDALERFYERMGRQADAASVRARRPGS